MADRDLVAQNQRVLIFHHVQNRAVLDIRARTDADRIDVAPDDDKRPDASIVADHDVSDDHRRGVNVSRTSDDRPLAFVRPDVRLASHDYADSFLRRDCSDLSHLKYEI